MPQHVACDDAMAPGFVAPGDSLAHVKGPEDVPLLSSTIYGAFQAQARRHLQRQALVVHDQNQSWTFASLLRHVDRAAQGFLDLGAERGDRIGVWLLNSGEWLIAQLATAKLGVILVNINPDYKLPELEYALNLVGCKMLIMIPTTPQSDYAKMIQELCPELSGAEKGALQCKRVPALRCVLVAGGDAMPGTIAFEHVYKDGEHTELASSCDEPVNIQFTSGTTGKPKATTLTHKGILNNAYFLGRTMRYSERDVVCVPVPLYHCFGCVMGNLSMVAFGCSLVYPAARFDPLLTLEAAATRSCTSLYGVPTMYIAMLDHPEFKKFDFTALRTGIMAGALCPVDTMNRVISEMGARDVTICYGMTETSPVSWQTRIGTSVELACSTVGQIHPHVECKVVDPETCALRRCGEPGELWTSGYCVMQGYWENAAATSESIVVDAQGARWMRTGDLAVISENGFCQIVGRIKDMILRGGENIFPREVEEPLIAHPEVSNAAVIGVPDARLGEQVCAWIAWRGGAPRYEASRHEAERRIRDYLQDRVAYFKIPKYILFRDDFPLTVTGKIRKVEMREITTRELRLQPPAAKL